MIDDADLDLLRSAAINVGGSGAALNVIVRACAYSCCGRGWQRRHGYEQSYTGWVDNLHEPIPDSPIQGSFMLYSVGLGTLGYVAAILFSDVELLELAPGLPPMRR